MDAVEKLKAFLESTPPNISERIPGLAEEAGVLHVGIPTALFLHQAVKPVVIDR